MEFSNLWRCCQLQRHHDGSFNLLQGDPGKEEWSCEQSAGTDRQKLRKLFDSSSRESYFSDEFRIAVGGGDFSKGSKRGACLPFIRKDVHVCPACYKFLSRKNMVLLLVALVKFVAVADPSCTDIRTPSKNWTANTHRIQAALDPAGEQYKLAAAAASG